MRTWSFKCVLVLLLSAPCTAAEDMLNGSPRGEKGGDKGSTVLWDLTHGVFLGCEPADAYSDLAALLADAGHTLTTTRNIGTETLSGLAVLVVCVGSSWFSAYTPAEIAQIETFVLNGGGVLLMGDNPDCPNVNVDPLAGLFGVACGRTFLSPPPYEELITSFSGHPVFTGVSMISYAAGGELQVASPGTAIAWYDGKAAAAAVSHGAGRAIVTGDFNFCDNEGLLSGSGNQAFIRNAFAWLAGGEGPQELFLRGDVDGNGVRNLADAIVLLSYLFAHGDEPRCRDAADADDSGRLNLNDPIVILNHLFGVLSTLPGPFLACDRDPTPDNLGCLSHAQCHGGG